MCSADVGCCGGGIAGCEVFVVVSGAGGGAGGVARIWSILLVWGEKEA
jgi:hypothetical protein